MKSKLEEKLVQYQPANEQELSDAVESVLRAEQSKGDDGKDFDLIDEAVDEILRLKGLDTIELNRKADALVEKILSEARNNEVTAKQIKRKKSRIKWYIPVAVIISLLISATIIAYAMGYNVLGMTGRAFKQLNEKIWYDNENSSIIVSNDSRRYSNCDEMIKNEGFKNLLWPSQVDDKNYTDDIFVTDYEKTSQILCSFNIEGSVIKYSVSLLTKLPIKDKEPVTIGNLDVYMFEYEDLYQADFEYKGNKYTITTSAFDLLENIIKNLEEK